MEHRRLSDNEFEQLWQETEARGKAHRLSAEFPQWQRRRQRSLAAAAMLTVGVAVAVPMLSHNTSDCRFDNVYCNRTDTGASQWADLAAIMLKEA